MIVNFKTDSMESYRQFLAVRRSPIYHISGRSAYVPDEYAHEITGEKAERLDVEYEPSSFLFDYQSAISKLAIFKRKYAAFVEPGYGKTLIMFEFARHCESISDGKPVLIIAPLMVIKQHIQEAERFYPGMKVQHIRPAGLQEFLDNGYGIGITNFESFNDETLRPGKVFAIAIDESSMLKSHYGKWGTSIIRVGRGVEWKLCLTGTPAPNDRIEYANHAVFLGACRTVNEFLARYFVNRGQTQNRWELKPYALKPFYRDLSHWCIFMTNPATYGWKDNAETVPPINLNIHQVDLTSEQKKHTVDTTGTLFVGDIGGIGRRSKLGQIAKGMFQGERISTNKPKFIADLCESFGRESALVWCKYNDEQEQISESIAGCANITGDTPYEERAELLDAFKAGQVKVMVTKGKILGFGLNLQIATRQVFSTLEDSYETYWQCVKRSNRVGSTVPLNVHIPITEVEEPMVQNVLQKAKRVQFDTEEQERIFKENAWIRF